MKRKDRRSNCPTNFAVEAFGDSWSLLIVRDLMFKGKKSYSEFANSEERISTNILSDRLKSLTSAGIVRREGTGRSSAYLLTEKGLDLLPVMVDMIAWSAKYDPTTSAPEEFMRRTIEDRDLLIEELEKSLRARHKL